VVVVHFCRVAKVLLRCLKWLCLLSCLDVARVFFIVHFLVAKVLIGSFEWL